MANLLNGDDGGDDIFVYTGGEQRVPWDVRRAKIDESIDTIPQWAFEARALLIEVEGHNKLKKIEKGAFFRCRCLRRLMKMNDLIEIEREAFNGCESLSDLEFVKLEIIGYGAFHWCKSLRSINLPSIRRVNEYAFQECTALTDAGFGKDLERIEGDALHYSALRRITIPLKDDLIGFCTFTGCHNLSRIDIVETGIHKTISSLHLDSRRDEMREVIESINQTLPDTGAVEKTQTIQQWIRSVFRDMEHYKVEHQIILKEAMTLLELALWKANLDENEVNGITSQDGVRVTRTQVKRARKERCITSGASIIIKNVLPFLQLS